MLILLQAAETWLKVAFDANFENRPELRSVLAFFLRIKPNRLFRHLFV